MNNSLRSAHRGACPSAISARSDRRFLRCDGPVSLNSCDRPSPIVLVLAFAMLSACRSQAATQQSNDPGNARLFASVDSGGGSADSQRPPQAAASTPAVSSSPIADVLEYSTTRLGWKSRLNDIHRGDAFANEQAAFLGRDLGIGALLRTRSTVAFANVFETVNGRRLHLGVVEVAFRRCTDLERTMKAAARVHRDYFKVPALSIFRTLRRDRSFLVVFSESPLEPTIKALLGSPPGGTFASTECRDSGDL